MPSVFEILGRKVKEITGSGEKPKDPVDDFFDKQLEKQVKEAKMKDIQVISLQRDEMIEELKAKQRKRQEEQEQGQGTLGVPSTNPQAALIANIYAALAAQGKTAEQINEYITKLSPEALLMANAVATNNPQMMFPMMLLMRDSKTTGVSSDVRELIKELAKPQQPNTIELIRTVKELLPSTQPQSNPLTEGLAKQAIDMVLEQIKNKPNAIKELIDSKKELEGLASVFAPAGTGTGQNLEWTRLHLDHDKWKTEMEWKREEELARLGFEKKKYDGLWKFLGSKLGLLDTLLAKAAEAAEQRMSTIGQGSSNVQQPQQVFIPTSTPMPNVPTDTVAQPIAPQVDQVYVECPNPLCAGRTLVSNPIPNSFTCEKCQTPWSSKSGGFKPVGQEGSNEETQPS